MATEANAVQILQARLEAEGGSAPITSLSVKVKWGQHDLQGFGHIRKFLSKHHEVFNLEGSSVALVKSTGTGPETAPKTTSKFAPQPPPASLAPVEAPKRSAERDGPMGPVRPSPSKIPRLDDSTVLDPAADVAEHGDLNGASVKGRNGFDFDFAPGAEAQTQATLLATAKTASRAVKVTTRAPSIPPIAPIAPTPKGTAKVKEVKEVKDESLADPTDAKSLAKEPPPWHTQRALSRAVGATPRQDASTKTAQTAEAAEAAWDDDTLSDDELRKAIAESKAHGMELELEELARKLVPSEEYRKDCQRAVLFLKSAFSQEFQRGVPFMHGSPRIEMGGSAVQNTELEGSDLDVVCSSLAGTHEEQESKMARFWEKICSPPHSNNLEATDAMRFFPHAPCQFSVKLKDLRAPGAKLHVHVILDSPSAEPSKSLDSVIGQLCDCYSLSRDLIRLVKFWATNHGLSNQHEGYITGVAWTAFVLCFLQRQQCVPPVAQLDVTKLKKPIEKGEKGEKPNLTELLRGFFQFVCAPQPTTPRGLSLEGVDCKAAPPPASHVGPPPPLYIEDPVCAQQGVRKNLASTLGESQWARILEESRRIADRLDPAKPQRWFYWAEVFDPQGLAGANKRLPKLSEMADPTASDAENATQDGYPSKASGASQAPSQATPIVTPSLQTEAAVEFIQHQSMACAGKGHTGHALFPAGNLLAGKGKDAQKGSPAKGWPFSGA